MPASLRSDGVRDHPGMPFVFPPERAFSFTGIPTASASMNSSPDASVATLRWCSGSSRNAVRLPSGKSVQLYRNPQQVLIADLLKQKEAAIKSFDEKLAKLGYHGNSSGKSKRSHHKKTASGNVAETRLKPQ